MRVPSAVDFYTIDSEKEPNKRYNHNQVIQWLKHRLFWENRDGRSYFIDFPWDVNHFSEKPSNKVCWNVINKVYISLSRQFCSVQLIMKQFSVTESKIKNYETMWNVKLKDFLQVVLNVHLHTTT